MNNISEKLFGKVKGTVYRAKGGNIPVLASLEQDLEGKNSVAHIFCAGCGTYLEANEKQAELLSEHANVELLKNFDKYYFEVAGCEVCDGDRSIVFLKSK